MLREWCLSSLRNLLKGYAENQGGTSTYGTIFELDPRTGTETVLHDFTGPDGAFPFDGLTQDSAGNLYSTINSGGSNDWGVVFRLPP